MILELKIKNFLSFKDEVTFSFEATKDKSFEDYQVVEVAPGIRILRLAIVYGANASGKSNLLKAFEFLGHFWFDIPENKDEKTGIIPFLLNKKTPKEASEFSLVFFIGSTKHLYSLIIDETKIVTEKLYIYPGTQPALIFERKLNGNISEIVFNAKKVKVSQAAKDEITVKCLANMSVFAAYNQVNVAIPEIENVIQWMKAQYMQSLGPDTYLIYNAEKESSHNKTIKEYILNFLRRADYNITNINAEEIEESVPEEMLSLMLSKVGDISGEEKERLKRDRTIKLTKTEFEHRILNSDGIAEFYRLPKGLQSDGTLRTFGLSGVIREVVEKNAFLAIDEIESSLHPRLVEFIIEDFFKQKGQSQMLLTTHYDGLLEEDDLLRKDSIWFTNKNESGSSELYSLADFKGVNRMSSLQKAYKYGKFGAIPNI